MAKHCVKAAAGSPARPTSTPRLEPRPAALMGQILLLVLTYITSRWGALTPLLGWRPMILLQFLHCAMQPHYVHASQPASGLLCGGRSPA
jgi:hypothetical protein